MKATNLFLLLFLFSLGANAQFDYNYITDFGDPKEVELTLPDNKSCFQLIPSGIDLLDGNQNNTIFYGQVPANSSNKPVLVFLHGYASNYQAFTEGCDNMYSDAFNAGYRTAFLSATPDYHMWTNGYMVDKMLHKITSRYGVDKVVAIGWSKGGVDLDAACTYFNAKEKVDRVITLSTPHHGTWIAEFSHNWLLIIPNLFFQTNNDASRCLQRGYMDYFRSVVDPMPTTNWITVGAWGNGPLNRLEIPQSLMDLNGGGNSQGGNDGVVSYSSSKRPGGNELFGGKYYVGWWPFGYYTGHSVNELDHMEVTVGKHMWGTIQNNLPNYNINNRTINNKAATPIAYNPNSNISGTGQMLISNGSEVAFKIEESAQATITVMTTTPISTALQLNTPSRSKVAFDKVSSYNEMLGAYQTSLQLDSPTPGTYRLATASNAVILVDVVDGVTAELNTGLSATKRIYEKGELAKMTVSVASEEQVTISGLLTKTTNLDASLVSSFEPIPASFERNKVGEYTLVGNEFMEEGIYSISIQVDGETFGKTIQTTIAVAKRAEVAAITNAPNANIGIAKVYPNPFIDQVSIVVEITDKPTADLEIFDLYGRFVDKIDITGLPVGKHEIRYTFEGGASAYILYYNGKEGKASQVLLSVQ